MVLDNPQEKAGDESNIQLSDECRAKFAPDGSPLHYSGATVLCHLRQTDAIYHSIIDNCFDMTKNPTLSKYVQLPGESLHMTLYDTRVYHGKFTGPKSTDAINEQNRVADLARFRAAFLALRAELRTYLPVKMMIDLSATHYPEPGDTLKVPVKPCSVMDGDKLRSIRERLCSAFEMPPPDHSYPFHITGYYPLHTMSQKQFLSVQRGWTESVKRISEDVPTFEIDRVELCSFQNMCHFEVEESVSSEL